MFGYRIRVAASFRMIEAGHKFKKKKTINSWIVGINLSIGTVCAFEIEGLGESGGKWR